MKLHITAVTLLLAGIGGYAVTAWNPLAAPSKARIIRPAPAASVEAAPLAGVWESTGPDSIPSRLVVEGIHGNQATILFAWGDHPDGLFAAGSIRARARLMPDGALFWRQLGGITFRLSADRRELLVTREPVDLEIVAHLRRVPPETALSALAPGEVGWR
jgi:hypothetical protein